MKGFGEAQAPPKKAARKKGKAGKAATQHSDGATTVKAARAAPAPQTDEQLREAHMAAVRAAVGSHAEAIATGLQTRGFATIDDFLSAEQVATLRAECEALRASGHMAASQSTRYDDESGAVVSYEKRGVLSTNLQGGDRYAVSPRLHEYCVALVSALPPLLNARVEGLRLCDRLHANKLAVCLGGGSQYDKHYDNMGGDDLRKLTVLLYLQTAWSAAQGGEFRMYLREGDEGGSSGESGSSGEGGSGGEGGGGTGGSSGEGGGDAPAAQQRDEAALAFVDVAPVGGRLLAFWADEMVHAVLPSEAPGGDDEHRWALTVWLQATERGAIHFDAAAEARHFPTGGLDLSG